MGKYDEVFKRSMSDPDGFWVRVSTINGGGNTVIYMYYGNSSAASTSNGDDTFDFFADFAVNQHLLSSK